MESANMLKKPTTITWSILMHWDKMSWGCCNPKELYWKKSSHEFLVGFNVEFDQIRVQILSKELPTLNETIAIIRAEESTCLNPEYGRLGYDC